MPTGYAHRGSSQSELLRGILSWVGPRRRPAPDLRQRALREVGFFVAGNATRRGGSLLGAAAPAQPMSIQYRTHASSKTAPVIGPYVGATTEDLLVSRDQSRLFSVQPTEDPLAGAGPQMQW